MVDHSVTEFKVVVRHLNRIGPDTIKDLIEKKYEVVKVEEVRQDHIPIENLVKVEEPDYSGWHGLYL